jgi:hypothetical protein
MTLRKFIACAQLVLLVAGLSLTTGCDVGTVTITYTQIANFYEYDPEFGAPKVAEMAGGGALFVMYKITAIQNKGANSKQFWFTEDNLYAKCLAPPNAICPGELNDEHNVLPGAPLDYLEHAKDQVVKAGTSVYNLGCIVIKVPALDPQKNLLSLVDLSWHYDGKSPQLLVNIVRDDLNTTVAWVHPMTRKILNDQCKGFFL